MILSWTKSFFQITGLVVVILIFYSSSLIYKKGDYNQIYEPELVEYNIDSSCSCKPRLAQSLKNVDESLLPGSINYKQVVEGQYVGKSTCNNYTTALGAGQRVLSYSFYTPPRSPHGRILEEDASDLRYTELISDIIQRAELYYPGWRIRIYHNITEENFQIKSELCRLYCETSNLDLCDVTNIHSLGNLNKLFPVGRFWRFQVVGDPTVEMFGSRDIDSFIQDREAFAVKEWLNSEKQFHIMRDGPFHSDAILAGLWGGKNYENMATMFKVKRALYSVHPSTNKYLDQITLRLKVWPLIRMHSVIHDSYLCEKGYVGPGW
ncbi:uncharacterized protein LOC111706882 isoform X3 [Eurytemora carolleeae]|nr:uncharacterized protein LOC111706882 isoform X2 [Eurytemora carolleeae]XP_023335587.1 uncharacterized protein LOC111706882 isoform X3 [Eurytemora carolleeae]|eukprot:XP_023335586.1 uncharacterized protein LOC111706882 isoform X2 [Eurytemora affinis]